MSKLEMIFFSVCRCENVFTIDMEKLLLFELPIAIFFHIKWPKKPHFEMDIFYHFKVSIIEEMAFVLL